MVESTNGRGGEPWLPPVITIEAAPQIASAEAPTTFPAVLDHSPELLGVRALESFADGLYRSSFSCVRSLTQWSFSLPAGILSYVRTLSTRTSCWILTIGHRSSLS